MALSQSAIDMVKATAPAVAPHAKTIVANFYKKMLGSHPELYAFFNKGHQSSGRQPQALTDAVLAYATNIDNLGVLGPAVGMMATKHCALQVKVRACLSPCTACLAPHRAPPQPTPLCPTARALRHCA